MMKSPIFCTIFCLILLGSCAKEEVEVPPCDNCTFDCVDSSHVDVITNDCLPNWMCSFYFTNDSRVETDAYYGVAEGDKRVFQMVSDTEGEDWIADDEFTNILVFEIDPEQTSFSAEDAALKDLRVLYKSICYCSEVMFREISSGCMQGIEQPDGSWHVQGAVVVPYEYLDIQVNFDAIFIE